MARPCNCTLHTHRSRPRKRKYCPLRLLKCFLSVTVQIGFIGNMTNGSRLSPLIFLPIKSNSCGCFPVFFFLENKTLLVSLPHIWSWTGPATIDPLLPCRYRLPLCPVLYLAFFGYFSPVVRPPILALGGVQLPLPVLQWSKRTERT